MNVPWLDKSSISEKASTLLKTYSLMLGHSVLPPVPVEKIIEKGLGLSLSFEDLEDKLGVKDVLGAIYLRSGKICINEKLLLGGSEGRMIFTCAHEAGHWVLHRSKIDEATRKGQISDAIICRTINTKERIEWQADYFAACLLMPEHDIRKAFDTVCCEDVLVLENIRGCKGSSGLYIEPCVMNWHFIADAVREAGGFSNVSKHAMIIRMQELGLLVNMTSTPVGWNNPDR